MDRVIKFRAWVKYEKVMVQIQNLRCDGYEIWTEIVVPEGEGGPYHPSRHQSNKDLEIMQFTGLHDKHGVEIFEGDIVSWDGGRVIQAVELKDNYGWTPTDLYNLDWWQNSEVIGNRFQNGDLLNG